MYFMHTTHASTETKKTLFTFELWSLTYFKHQARPFVGAEGLWALRVKLHYVTSHTHTQTIIRQLKWNQDKYIAFGILILLIF